MSLMNNQLQRAESWPRAATTGPTSSLAKRLVVPSLADPESLDPVAFNGWKARWLDYLRLTRVEDELPDPPSQHAFLRTALDPAWVQLWDAGRLGVRDTDELEAVVGCLGNYLRARRNLLLDRQRFYAWNQQSGETLDQYYAALTSIERACDFQDEHCCSHCNRVCASGLAVREVRPRDRLICGLSDKELVCQILEQQFSNDLSLDKVLQLCATHESSKETGVKLDLETGQ